MEHGVGRNNGVDTDERVGAALSSVVQSGQRLLAEEIGLAVVEGRVFLERTAIGAACVGYGLLLLSLALASFEIAAIAWMVHGDVSPWVALSLCGLFNGALGAALIVLGRRQWGSK